MRYLYTLLFYLALPLILLRLFIRGRRIPGYRSRLRERFGFVKPSETPCIWIHAVSVGETMAAIPLIKKLKIDYPNVPIIVTNMTPTGADRVKAAFGDTVLQTFIPYDLPGSVARFLDRTQPKLAIILETELWPNLFAALKKRAIPILIANACLSEKSFNGYQLIRSFIRNVLTAVHKVAAQTPLDASRFQALGVLNEKVITVGNLKFDLELPADLPARSELLRKELGPDRLIWIAASTHPKEEEIMLAAHKIICAKNPAVLLILVPRHPDRFAAVADLCAQNHFKTVRRSTHEPCVPETQVYLGDTMGELLLMYSVADVTLVAGSFAPIGGHNLLEPAALGKPILTGPLVFNIPEVCQLLADVQGMQIVQDAEDLAQTVLCLLEGEAERQKMGQSAYQVVQANRGALQKQMHLIQELLN